MVCIGLVGPKCAGVKTAAHLLVSENGFVEILVDGGGGGGGGDGGAGGSTLVVRSLEDALEHVQKQWQKHFVVSPITDCDQVGNIRKRPYGLVLGVDAPIMERFARAQRLGLVQDGLEQFVHDDDKGGFGSGGIRTCLIAADHVIINNGSVDDLRGAIANFNPTNEEHVRPGWDTYFMRLAFHASLRSNCMKRRVGAVLVSNNRVVATGYNGTPRATTNCNEGGCPRCNGGAPRGQGLEHCFCMHAEENALLEAGRERGDGTTMYTTLFPCLMCAKKMVQVGVKKVVYADMYETDDMCTKLLESVGTLVVHHHTRAARNV